MNYEAVYDFNNLYKAHIKSRKGKSYKKEVIEFEMKLSENLIRISEQLKNKSYKMKGYYSFYVSDPKRREIHALHYADRVVQHCLCDEIFINVLDRRLIYDNAACRVGKGNHFALNRLTSFFRNYSKTYGCDGYILKCDIKKFFDNIDHDILKAKLRKVFFDEEILWLIDLIIDSYETANGKGLPLGNQTSQWFAIFYLDSFDRIIKEKMRIKYYTRYMDDCVMLHHDKNFLVKCKSELEKYITEELHLNFNTKTQIFPIKQGVDYLGFHFYLTDTQKVVKKVRNQTKKKYKRKLQYIKEAYANDEITFDETKQILSSYYNHLKFGNTYCLRKNVLAVFKLKKHEHLPPIKGGPHHGTI